MNGERDESLILHITTDGAWKLALFRGEYEADSLAIEGFIHCSTFAQIEATAMRYYAGRRDLILLVIDRARVRPTIKFEGSGDEFFPHIYGPLNLDAVLHVAEFPPQSDGTFRLTW